MEQKETIMKIKTPEEIRTRESIGPMLLIFSIAIVVVILIVMAMLT